MIKALFLIFEPAGTWERLSLAGRSTGFVLVFHLLPTMLVAIVAECLGMAHWGKWQSHFQTVTEFTTRAVVTFGVVQFLLFLAMVFVSALILLQISQTFQHRESFQQAFTTVAYGFSPFFVLHLLNAAPHMNPWVVWLLGIATVFWVMYQGIPRMMKPDPTHAFGLYFSTVLVMFLTSAIAAGLPALYLMGQVSFQNSWLTHQIPGLFQ